MKNIGNSSRKFTSLLIAISLGLIVSLVIIPVLLISINQVVKNGEKRFTELEVIRVENIIQNEINQAAMTLDDWSNWNDTYQFARDGNQQYIDNNLTDESMQNLDINFLVILNAEKQIIYQKYFDRAIQAESKSPIDIQMVLQDYPELVAKDGMTGNKGLAYSQGQSMLIVSNPVLTSLVEGPSSGTIIFIKLFDDTTINELSQLTMRDLALYSDIPENLAIPEAGSLDGDIFVRPEENETITGYKYLEDLNGNNHLLLEVKSHRDLFLQGRATKLIVSGITLFLILCLSITAYLFTNAVLDQREKKKEEEVAAELLEKTRQNAIELEKRVIERTRELEQKNKDLETFNYTVSHDLKSPLRGISGFSSLLLRDYSSKLDSEGKIYLQNLVDGAQRMDRLIEDLLLYTRTERHNINKTDVDLKELIDKVLLEYSSDVKTRNISIQTNLECRHLSVDRDGIVLVLRNLLDNAVKFTKANPKPKIIITSKAKQDSCIISVTDNGIGFDLKFHDKIFEIFQRLHLSEDYAGTGIGLALVKRTAERLGGQVCAESEIGVGSTFHVEIPLDPNSGSSTLIS